MKDKVLSIVLPVWNRADILIPTLRSIASQEGIDRCCLIIVDNNSSDNTFNVAQQWIATEAPSSLKCTISNCSIPGAAATRNAGIKLVDTPWTMHFDSDDILLPGAIVQIINKIDKLRNLDMITWDVDQETTPGKTKKVNGVKTDKNQLYHHLIHSTAATQRYAIRTEFLFKSGLWNESCLGWDDYELGARILKHRPKIVHIDNILVKQRLSPNSITEETFSNNPSKWEHPLKVMSNEFYQSQSALRWIDYRRAILAADYRREGNKLEAHRLLNIILRNKSQKLKLLYKSIYRLHRIYHRGTHHFASIFITKNITLTP